MAQNKTNEICKTIEQPFTAMVQWLIVFVFIGAIEVLIQFNLSFQALNYITDAPLQCALKVP